MVSVFCILKHVQFVLVNVVVAVLMKHLEESNSNAADGEEEGPKREELIGQSTEPSAPADHEHFSSANHQPHELAPQNVPIISVTEADSDGHTQDDDQERSESPRPEVAVAKPEVIDSASPAVVIIEPGKDDRRRDEFVCQISQQDSLDNSVAAATCKNQSLRSKKMEGLKSQKAFDEPPRISHHVIYEESSDSEGHIRSSEGHGRNVKRVARKTRGAHISTRAHLLHGMRIDSIEDHEGSSSPPYDDTRASESANSLNDFYLE